VGLTDYETWAHRRNRDLLTRPLYRALFVLLTPERLLNGMQRRWNQFRRGTSVELLERGTDRVVLRVRFPTDLYEQTALHGLRGALRAALEAAGARGARIELVDSGPRDARYAVQWR
jgi:uncharacterized protein (TIGR02265 family)